MLYLGLCMTEHLESRIVEFGHHCLNLSHESNQSLQKDPGGDFQHKSGLGKQRLQQETENKIWQVKSA